MKTVTAWFHPGPPCQGCDWEQEGIVVNEKNGASCHFCEAPVHLNGQHKPPVAIVRPAAPEVVDDNHHLTPRGNARAANDEWQAYPCNDLGNAQRLWHSYGANMRHVEAWGWLVWDGTAWRNDTHSRLQAFGKTIARTMLGACGPDGDIDPTTDSGKAWVKWAQITNSRGRIDAMIDLARSEPGISMNVDHFDAHDDYLNCQNGMLHLPTGDLVRHGRDFYCTRSTSVPYDADAECPQWEQFLEEVTRGDDELQDYLQTAVGYSLTGSTQEQKLFFLFGDGANGKSTFLEVVRDLCGSYAATLPFEAFLRSRTSERETALNPLPGARFTTAVEAGEGRAFDEETIKAVTGGDVLRARRRYKDSYEFKPNAKIWLAANDKPSIAGVNEGIWRRFHILPFQADIPAEQRDPYLGKRLREEMPGILAWAVRGAKRWYIQGLTTPQCVKEALEEYRTDNDVISRFLADCFLIEEHACTPAATIKEAFTAWAKSQGERDLSQTALGNRLRKYRAGILRKDRGVNGRIVWNGLQIVHHVGRSLGIEDY